MMSNNKKGMYNIRHPADQYMQIGDSRLIRVEAIGDINLVFHQLDEHGNPEDCLLYTSPSPRDKRQSRMPSSA